MDRKFCNEKFHNLLLENLLTIIGFLQVPEGALHILLIFHLFELKGLTIMCIIVMYADYNGLCIGPFSMQCIALRPMVLVSIVSGPYFEIFFGVWAYVGVTSVSPLPLGHHMFVRCKNVCVPFLLNVFLGEEGTVYFTFVSVHSFSLGV